MKLPKIDQIEFDPVEYRKKKKSHKSLLNNDILKEHEVKSYKEAYQHYFSVSKKLADLNQKLERDNKKLTKLVAYIKENFKHDKEGQQEYINDLKDSFNAKLSALAEDSLSRETAYKAKIEVLSKEVEHLQSKISQIRRKETNKIEKIKKMLDDLA